MPYPKKDEKQPDVYCDCTDFEMESMSAVSGTVEIVWRCRACACSQTLSVLD